MAGVLIVDDHPMVAKYTRQEVASLIPGVEVLVAYTLGEAENTVISSGEPDYILLDLMLPDCQGLAGLVSLRKLAPHSVIAILSGETDPRVMRDCFAQGARGFLTKSTGADEFSEALGKLFANGFFYPPQAADPLPARTYQRLTHREIEVLQVLATGKLNKQLAALLGVSESTFKTYLRNIFEKLNVRTRVEAVRRGLELGLIDTRRC